MNASTCFPQPVFFLLLMALVLCGNALRPGDLPAQPPVAGPRPHVVVIMSDDQGWGDLSLHGNTNLSTPHLDSLARDGVRFENFFVCPLCSPTRCEFLTGRFAARSHVFSTSSGGERMDLGTPTLADSFQAAGYRTAALGKWHNGTQYPYHPLGRGFQEFYGFCSGHWGNYWSPLLEHNGEIVTGNGYLADDLTDHAITLLKQTSPDPLFLWLAYNTPHSPMQVPDAYWDKFENAPLALRHRDPAKEDLMHTRAALAMCENIDWNVGRLLRTLDEAQLTEQTIVVFLSDNGPNGWRFNGGMKGRKGSTDEGGVRSPLLIRWPQKIAPGSVVTPIASVLDLYPTLTQLCQVVPQNTQPFDGQSLVPLLASSAENSLQTAPANDNQNTNDNANRSQVAWPDRQIIANWGKNVSVRTQRFRLDQDGRLFDMQNDPGQNQDIAQRFPDVTQQLTESANAFRAAHIPDDLTDTRPFVITHSQAAIIQLPARDATTDGEIQRSNRHPNSSYFTNWKRTEDRIHWNAEALDAGQYEVELFYSCPPGQQGSRIELTFGDARLSGTVAPPHPPVIVGPEQDRTPRIESYEQEWGRMILGRIDLPVGRGPLTLQATKVAAESVMDFRLLTLRRVEEKR